MENNNELRKEITLDDLALMVAKGFNKIDERFEKMDEKMSGGFKDVYKRLDKIDERLENIEADLHKKVDKIDHNTLIYRVEKLEKKFA